MECVLLPNWLRKILYLLPSYNSNDAQIDGSMVFTNDCKDISKLITLNELFEKQSAKIYCRINIPVGAGQRQRALAMLKLCKNIGIEPIALLDHYYNNSSMVERITQVASTSTTIFEIFNELPGCSYPGEQIVNNDVLIGKINGYDAIIKKYCSNAKTISMASLNILHTSELTEYGWRPEDGTNLYQQQFIVENLSTDYTGIHLYCSSYGQKRQFWDLMKAEWLKKKPLFITECGEAITGKHIGFYKSWTSRFVKYLNPEAIMWYRQSTQTQSSADAGFALETVDGWKSDLYTKLMKD